jgi:DNA helicase-2/ATP-dependent DNA helicase PcrA
MPSPSGHVVLASAGSGKTTWIARQVRDHPHERAVVATYTTTNSSRVEERIWREAGRLPEWARIRTWFTFLLEDLVRPYQSSTGRSLRVAGINLAAGISAKFVRATDWKYWFDSAGRVYSDKISAFAIRCDEESGGAVLRRLARLYDRIYLDEIQDVAGPDLDIIERIMKAGIRVTMVGDPRQGTYSTNMARRNARFRGAGIVGKFNEWEKRALCVTEKQNHSFRCRPEICRLADHLFPDYPKIESRNEDLTLHDGVFLVRTEHAPHYVARHRPAILRWDRREECQGFEAMNFGESKGQEYERVLVFPTGPIRKWIATGDAIHVQNSLAKLYVAVTRARQSVGFVYDGKVGIGALLTACWTP